MICHLQRKHRFLGKPLVVRSHKFQPCPKHPSIKHFPRHKYISRFIMFASHHVQHSPLAQNNFLNSSLHPHLHAIIDDPHLYDLFPYLPTLPHTLKLIPKHLFTFLDQVSLALNPSTVCHHFRNLDCASPQLFVLGTCHVTPNFFSADIPQKLVFFLPVTST